MTPTISFDPTGTAAVECRSCSVLPRCYSYTSNILRASESKQSSEKNVRLEVFTAVIMKNGVFWDVTPRGSCKNRCFGGISASIIRVTRISEVGTTLAATSNRRTLRRNTKTLFCLLLPCKVRLVPLSFDVLFSSSVSHGWSVAEFSFYFRWAQKLLLG
jgi:hypothetical protein